MADKEKRRAVLLSLLGGGAVAANALPDKWFKPVVDRIVLPAHGNVSECEDDLGIDECPDSDDGP